MLPPECVLIYTTVPNQFLSRTSQQPCLKRQWKILFGCDWYLSTLFGQSECTPSYTTCMISEELGLGMSDISDKYPFSKVLFVLWELICWAIRRPAAWLLLCSVVWPSYVIWLLWKWKENLRWTKYYIIGAVILRVIMQHSYCKKMKFYIISHIMEIYISDMCPRIPPESKYLKWLEYRYRFHLYSSFYILYTCILLLYRVFHKSFSYYFYCNTTCASV